MTTSFSPLPMPTKQEQDNILEKGFWQSAPQDANLAKSKWGLDLFRPAFLTKTSGPRKQLSRTGYLDGLRGFAALLVYVQHHELWIRDALDGGKILENGFGYNGQYYFACLPFVRTFFTGGHFGVPIFFVISGYVLSAKTMSLLHAGEHVKVGDTLASALFRRWIRLYIPVIATTFIYMTVWHFPGFWTDHEHEGKYRDEVWKWYTELKNFSFVFGGSGLPWFSYNVHVWTIPVEFKGSLVVYTSLLAFSRCTRNARLWLQAGLIFYFMYITDGSFYSMFVGGMLLCDLDLLALENNLPSWFSRLEPYKDAIFFHLFVFSMWIGSIPSHTADVDDLAKNPGWYYLSLLKPQAVFDYKWFYLFFASVALVASAPRISWLKSFFETRFCQYLGRISFALYLMHGPVMFILGDRVYSAAGWVRESHKTNIPGWVEAFPLPKSGPLGLELAFLLPHLILLPVTLWLSEIVTRLFDTPSVKFGQWLYRKTQAPSPRL